MGQRFVLMGRRLFRSPLFLGGVLICCLGLANWVVGRVKMSQYEALAAHSTAPSSEGVNLSSGFTFFNVSENHEHHNIAVAKVQYYSVVLMAGELLAFAGLALIAAGYIRLRFRASGAKNKTLLDSS